MRAMLLRGLLLGLLLGLVMRLSSCGWPLLLLLPLIVIPLLFRVWLRQRELEPRGVGAADCT